MKKIVVALACCLAISACAKKEEHAAAQPSASPATAAVEPANTGLPTECENYINRVKACVAKSAGAGGAAQFQQALDQSKAQWDATPDKASLVPACKAANDQFAQMAAALKCE